MRAGTNERGTMNHTPEQQWSALSALYEEADGLPEHALPAWLARLEAAGHPLLSQLRRMLDARDHLDTDDFLGTLPKLSAAAPDASEWSAGRRVGPYRLERPLGEGGMAEVWLAVRDDGAFKRQVAIKLPYPRPGRESLAQRFDRERDILASLRHPHIAGLYDAGVTPQGQAWLALEYVEGQPISTFCDERRLSVRERVLLFRQVLLAVQHAHANLVIHRDLKPGNILVTPQGEVRLLDFGIAKLLEAEGDAIEETELTRQAGRSLTPRYASPEQVTGLPLTIACDVYSLGVVFYELVSGERPYELKVESPAQLEHAILETEPRPPSRRAIGEAAAQARSASVKSLRRELSPELDAIALRCMAKKPSARYTSVDALLGDVDRWLAGDAVLARAPSAWYRIGKFAKRHRWGVGLGAAAVVALAVVAAAAVVLGLQAREESARAMAARDFMLSLFKRADQEKSRGADITARELLEAGRKDLAKRLPGQPRLQAELLLGIADIQTGMREYAAADGTLAEAARIFDALGLARDQALALAAHANNAMRAGDIARAEALVQRARSVPGRPLDDAALDAQLAEIEGWAASMAGDAAKATTLFEASRRSALRAHGPHHIRTTNALHGLIYTQRQARNYDAALALQDQLEAAVANMPGLDPKEVPSLHNGRAEVLHAAGRYAEALNHLVVSLPACEASLGPNEEWCRRLLLTKTKVLLRLGHTQQPADEVRKVEALAGDDADPILQAEALLLLLRRETTLGASARQQAVFERVRVLGMSETPATVFPVLKVRALLGLAEAQLMLGDAAAAQPWIERSLASQRGADGQVAPTLFAAVARSLMGISQLQQGRSEQALQWLEQAHADFAQALGGTHPLTLLFSLNTAATLERLGRDAEARALVDAAEPVLRKSLGDTAPLYQRVHSLQNAPAAGRPRVASDAVPPRVRGLEFFS
jgi:serine/threonine protein kinase/tetratricopeptide (TPR) repeat protein